MDTTMATACCYEDCVNAATTTDVDGDPACERHADLSGEYVVVTDLHDGRWLDPTSAARVETLLAAEGWTVTIRESRRGECEGTYVRQWDGRLQVLGYSIPEPDALRAAIERAVDQAYSGA